MACSAKKILPDEKSSTGGDSLLIALEQCFFGYSFLLIKEGIHPASVFLKKAGILHLNKSSEDSPEVLIILRLFFYD